MSTTVKYKGNTIATLDGETKALKTAGTWVENDIEITDVSVNGGNGGYIEQDGGYLIVDKDVPVETNVSAVSIISNGDYVAPNNTAYNPVTIDVPERGGAIIDRTVTEVIAEDLEGITTIGAYAFRYCDSLTSVNLGNNITAIGNNAFEYCSSLKEIEFPASTTAIWSNAFSNSGLTSIIVPETVTTMGTAIFDTCKSLITAELRGSKNWETSYGSRYLFRNNTALESVKFIHTNIAGNGSEFNGCTSLVDVYCPKNNLANPSTYGNCTALRRLALPATSACYTAPFTGCTNLEKIDFGVRTQFFRQNIFQNCSSLTTIILRGDTLTSLTYTSVFDGTPFASGGTGGTIYIPKVLYDELGTGSSLDYKAATNWSTFDGYGTITWAQIEGSQYENYYVDDRGVLQTVTENLTNCSISNDIAHYHTEFVTDVVPDDGYTINTVSVTMNSVDITNTAYDSTTNTITIASPDGEIVITATAA